jgi:hypothetical protein
MKNNTDFLKDVSKAAEESGNIKTLGSAIGTTDYLW